MPIITALKMQRQRSLEQWLARLAEPRKLSVVRGPAPMARVRLRKISLSTFDPTPSHTHTQMQAHTTEQSHVPKH